MRIAVSADQNGVQLLELVGAIDEPAHIGRELPRGEVSGFAPVRFAVFVKVNSATDVSGLYDITRGP